MIIAPINSLTTFDAAAETKPSVSKKDNPPAASGIRPTAQPTRSASPDTIKPVETSVTLTSDKIYDRRDSNQDSTVSYEESLKSERENPTPSQGTAAYDQTGKATIAPGTPTQGSVNLLV